MESVDLIASKTGDLPALPDVATKVMELVRDPDTGVKDLEDVISKDPALTARVLRIANSAMFGLRAQVSTVSRAIVVLGFNTLRSIVLAASTQALYRTKGSRFKDRILWEHSLAVALASRSIARHIEFPAAEEAFVAGLIHDIGKVVLDANLGDRYQQVIERVYNDGESFSEAETSVFGFDHSEVGALVVKKWTLAPELEEAVRLHHRPGEATIDPKLCAIVDLGNRLCMKLEIGPEKRADMDLPSVESAGALGLGAVELEEILGNLRETIEEEKDLFAMA